MTSFNPTVMSYSILSNFGGPVVNNLNHILGNLDDLSADTEIPSHATYIDTLSLECKLPSAKDNCTVFSLNIQSINAKLDYLSALVNDLSGIDVYGDITLGNIYRPPKCNNNDQVISTFINELAPVIAKLGKECSETIIVGDFNIGLLIVGERQKYAEYLDLFQTNSFYPKLILPTRFSSKSCTLKLIFCKATNANRSASANIINSDI